uniref:START domain-containing protein n=1 Tax=viral metagenome TaxID=1070528 RepID=A0A6C0C6S0_9ZZZZ
MEPAFNESNVHNMRPKSSGFDFEYAKSLISMTKWMFKLPGWQTVVSKDANSATSLQSKQFPNCALPHYYLDVTVKAPRAELVNKIFGVSTLQEAIVDNPNIIEFDLLESSPNFKIRRQVDRLGGIIWDRETVFIQSIFEGATSTWLVGYSVDHRGAPLKSDVFVRTNVMQSVYQFKSNNDKTTRIRRIANVNPNGWIPIAAITGKAKVSVNQFNNWVKLYDAKE